MLFLLPGGILGAQTDSLTIFPEDCFSISAANLRCGTEEQLFSFRFTNHSPLPVDALRILPPEGATADLLRTDTLLRLYATVPPDSTYASTISIAFEDTDGDGVFCFDLILRQLSASRNINTFCCYATVCLELDALPVSGGEGELIAVDDTLFFGGEPFPEALDLLANDLVPGEARVRLLQQPDFGEAALSEDGFLSFSAPPCFLGSSVVTYEVTDLTCPDLRATARVLFQGEGPRIYNAITPDGDGLNETFVFEVLEQCPERFPDNEMIIFNRWGNVVYTARPYRNEWGGTNQRGQLLPDATYYYILRLDISNGIVLRGDVTVVW